MITTFVSTDDDVRASIRAGATHLIIEHSRITIRSFYQDDEQSFAKFGQLCQIAKALLPSINLSMAIDILPHEDDFGVIQTAIQAGVNAGIRSFRIQDIGLASLIRELVPNATITLAPEIGYHSAESLRLALDHVDWVSVSNEVELMTLSGLGPLSQRVEVQVQGPIMIQYSYRRYLDGLFGNAVSYDRRASDTGYVGRQVRFYDSPNGTVMYLYFDRCLLRELPQLRGLSLHSWLIDARGESPEYRNLAISTYRSAFQCDEIDPSSIITTLSEISEKAQRPGFFLRNNTDQDRDRLIGDRSIGAVVRDSVKDRYLVIEIRQFVSDLPDRCEIVTTKNELKIATSLHYRDAISLKETRAAKPGELLLIPWIAGVGTKSTLLFY
ncbi:hypothetical protein EBR57_00555 [bacterium]|nr:hypothetical protein [bacterium]